MESSIVVMIVVLAMPNGTSGYSVKQMASVDQCLDAARIEVSDPFVAGVQCSQIASTPAKAKIKSNAKKPVPETNNARSTG